MPNEEPSGARSGSAWLTATAFRACLSAYALAVSQGVTGDVRGADAVAVGDRSQPLYRAAQQPAEGLGLRLTQLWELLGHVRDRAVMLAQLLTAGQGLAGHCGLTGRYVSRG